jgi:hypothetical protein
MTVAITAVIPVYNRAHLLERAVGSVWGQELPPVELVIVDDGSTDDTAAVVADLPGNNRYLYQDNAGGAAARNRGVAEATTEWVAFLDSDDVWRPDHLCRVAAAIDATGGVADLYFTDVARTDEEGGGTTFGEAGLQIDGSYELRLDARSWAVAARQPAMLQGLVVRKSAFEELGGLWTALSSRHDTHFFYFAFAERPACAVAAVTVDMTADEATSNRLTGGVGNRGRRFVECTVQLYGDVLARRTDPHERALARALLGNGLKGLAVLQWRDGDRTQALGTALRALRTAPTEVLMATLPGRRTRRRVRRARAALES